MMAAPPLSPSSSSSSSGVNLFGNKVFLRSLSLPPLRAARMVPRASASCTSAAEREREREKERINGSRFYQCSEGSESGGRAMLAGTLYDVLEVATEASAEEIKAAYRRLARSYHPDVVRAEDRRGAAAEFMRIHAAYATLSDPEKRAEYDCRVVPSPAARWRRRASARESPPSSSYYSPSYRNSPSPTSSYRPRTWETDQCW